MRCHEAPVRRPPPRLLGSAVPRCPAYRFSIRLRSGPVRLPAPPSCRLRGPVSRVSPARACGRGGGRIAAARFARVIARARRRAHLARPFPPGSFSRPPAMRLRRKGKRAAPETALPSTPILAHFANNQAPKQTKSEFLQNRGRNLRHPFLPGFGYRQKQGLWAGPTGFTHLSLVASQRTPQPSPRPPSRGPASILAAAPDRGPG